MHHIKQIASRLDAYGLDAMLVTSFLSKQYAMGYPIFAGTLLVSGKGSWYLADGGVLAGYHAEEGGPAPVAVSGGNFAAAVEELMSSIGAVTLGFEEEAISWKEFTPYQDLSRKLVPAQALMTAARCAKSPDEIELLRQVQDITDKAFAEAVQQVRPGMTEHEVAGLLAGRMMANGAFTLSFPPIVSSGLNGCDPHGFATDKVIQEGEFVTMDFGCVANGYCSDMTRTVALGHVTDEMRRVYDTVLAAQLAGMAAAKAGVIGREIDAAGRKVIEDAGYGPYFTHNFGHGLGIDGHETPGAGRLDTTPLPVGAVVSAEPGIYIPGKFGVRIEDIIVIGETGCETLMHTPKELLILD